MAKQKGTAASATTLRSADLIRNGTRFTVPGGRRSKFNAVKTTVDGITFDSKKEARRYQELKALEKAGKIARLQLQRPFHLSVPKTNLRAEMDADWLLAIGHYVADFCYDELTPTATVFVVEDVKGFKTPLYRWKKKHVEAQYGITIREI